MGICVASIFLGLKVATDRTHAHNFNTTSYYGIRKFLQKPLRAIVVLSNIISNIKYIHINQFYSISNTLSFQDTLEKQCNGKKTIHTKSGWDSSSTSFTVTRVSWIERGNCLSLTKHPLSFFVTSAPLSCQ